MKPWFEKEADIIDFPAPKEKVIKMPSVAEYPDFITGVLDLQARRDKGQISKDSYDRLYTELIHRFMKKESFENPWFLREAPDELQQVKQLLLKQIDSEQELAVLKKMLSVMKNAGVDDKIAKPSLGYQCLNASIRPLRIMCRYQTRDKYNAACDDA